MPMENLIHNLSLHDWSRGEVEEALIDLLAHVTIKDVGDRIEANRERRRLEAQRLLDQSG